MLNAVMIGVGTFQTVTDHPNVQISFLVIDQIVLSVFIFEIILKWLYDFRLFWKVFLLFNCKLSNLGGINIVKILFFLLNVDSLECIRLCHHLPNHISFSFTLIIFKRSSPCNSTCCSSFQESQICQFHGQFIYCLTHHL